MTRFPLVFACTTAVFTLAACSTPRTDTEAASATATPQVTERCDATRAQSLVGEAATDELVERARVAAGAATARTLRPDQMATLEYREDRLNLRLDASGVVASIDCG